MRKGPRVRARSYRRQPGHPACARGVLGWHTWPEAEGCSPKRPRKLLANLALSRPCSERGGQASILAFSMLLHQELKFAFCLSPQPSGEPRTKTFPGLKIWAAALSGPALISTCSLGHERAKPQPAFLANDSPCTDLVSPAGDMRPKML